MQNEETKKKFLDDNKNVAILILSIILCIIVILFLFFFILNQVEESQKIDASNYSSTELIDMLEEDGYKINLYYRNSTYISTIYIILENEKEGITIQRIYNTAIGNIMTFDDDSINDEMADLINTSENDTPEKEQQYKAFENWLEKYNITKLQISNMLDTYYTLHKNEAQDLDVLGNELLNSDI